MTFQRITHSIITRILLLGIAIALISAAGRYYLLSNVLRGDIEALVTAQQEATAGYVARDVDQKILARRHLLEQLAATLPLPLLDKPAALRAWLGERHELQPLFSEGLFVTNTDGLTLGDYPYRPERTGMSYADRDYIRSALSNSFVIGKPVMGRVAGKPILPMAAPVVDASGKVRAVLAGITALAAPGFLDLLQEGHIGKTGGFLLISPRDQLFVAASKPELVLQATAAPGVNALHDRAMQGGKGSGITTNAQGVEEIAAFVPVPSTGWFVVARLPIEEAFAPIQRVQRFVVRNIAIIISIFIGLLSLGLLAVFRPLLVAANHADRMTRGELPLEPLPVKHQDEVGHLTEAFNRLLAKLMSSQSELAHKAHHDELTGLPNRLLLADRVGQLLARTQRNQTRLAVLFMDLDGFKPINDTLGHEAGDTALIEVARRLSAVVRDSDTIARVGGDEFVVIMGDLDPLHTQNAAASVAEKCVLAVARPLHLKDAEQTLGVSIGIALGDGNSSFDALMSAADNAMYRAKEAGRGQFIFAE